MMKERDIQKLCNIRITIRKHYIMHPSKTTAATSSTLIFFFLTLTRLKKSIPRIRQHDSIRTRRALIQPIFIHEESGPSNFIIWIVLGTVPFVRMNGIDWFPLAANLIVEGALIGRFDEVGGDTLGG